MATNLEPIGRTPAFSWPLAPEAGRSLERLNYVAAQIKPWRPGRSASDPRAGNMSVTLVAALCRQGRLVVDSEAEGEFDSAADHSTSSSPSARCGLKPRYARPGVKGEVRSVRDESQMNVAALFTWMVTISAGLALFVISIIEYDREFQSAAATRLPVPVISAHALLGTFSLMLWIGYLLLGKEPLAWAQWPCF